MAWAAGVGLVAPSLFHLVNHAGFKALLFLGAGLVIHAVGNAQDVRRLGGLAAHLPVTYIMLGVASLSLAGLPFTAGCESKDAVLELAGATYIIWARSTYTLGAVTAVMTAFYSVRVLALVMWAAPAGAACVGRSALSESSATKPAQAALSALFCLLPLAAAGVGWALKPLILSPASPALLAALADVPALVTIDGEYAALGLRLLPVVASLAGCLGALAIQLAPILIEGALFALTAGAWRGLAARWHVDAVINQALVMAVLNGADRVTFQVIDKGLVEAGGPAGSSA
jgi:NADH:ubiquinone oxidoreductase subunit 5 (subunit L)/multisubunit Na+/H+ antiporter MnhA subunit